MKYFQVVQKNHIYKNHIYKIIAIYVTHICLTCLSLLTTTTMVRMYHFFDGMYKFATRSVMNVLIANTYKYTQLFP